MNYSILPGGKRARLLDPHYFLIAGQVVCIPAGFEWDGATGPNAVLRLVLGLNRFGEHDQATAEHDFVYERKGKLPDGVVITRNQSDQLFRDRLSGIRWKGIRLKIAHRGVRFFGFFYWNQL